MNACVWEEAPLHELTRSEMNACVWEEAPLHELTRGTVDHLGADREVVHGPWSAEECQAVLIPWHVAGWIKLVANFEPPWSLTPADWQGRTSRDGAFVVLSSEDATALLSDPGRWALQTADGQAMLCRTDEGEAHEYPEWLELAEKGCARG
jgi:hypothetical protein